MEWKLLGFRFYAQFTAPQKDVVFRACVESSLKRSCNPSVHGGGHMNTSCRDHVSQKL